MVVVVDDEVLLFRVTSRSALWRAIKATVRAHADSSSTLPVANSTKSVHESTDGLGEVGVEHDGASVVRNRLLNLSRVLDRVGEVGESDVLCE